MFDRFYFGIKLIGGIGVAFPHVLPVQCAAARLLGAGRWRFGSGLDVRRLLHHQKTPEPSRATIIKPIITNLITHRIANFAIRKKIASRTTPAIKKMFVKLIYQLAVSSGQCAAGKRQ